MTAALPACLPIIGCPAKALAGDIASSVAGSVLGAIASAITGASTWLMSEVTGFILDSSSPDLGAQWFGKDMELMEEVLVVLVVPMLMAASIGPILRRDGGRLFRVWAVGLPVAALAGVAAPQIAAIGLNVTDELCGVFASHLNRDLGGDFAASMATMSVYPVFLQILTGLVALLGGLCLWMEMLLREAAIYLTVFFMPLALGTFIWPSIAGLAKRVVEVLVALIASKLVIVAALLLGVNALNSPGLTGPIAGAAILMLASFAPFTLLRLAPVVETAAIAHLEGVSRRPGRVAAQAGMAAGRPAFYSILSARSGGDEQAPEPVRAQPIPEHEASWRPPTSGGDVE